MQNIMLLFTNPKHVLSSAYYQPHIQMARNTSYFPKIARTQKDLKDNAIESTVPSGVHYKN